MKAVILMTRVPIPGQTKTRLMEILSPEECAEIHFCFLKDIFETLGKLDGDISLFTAYTPEEEFHLIEDILPENSESFAQVGETLGERMMNSFERVMEMGYGEVVLIGSDLPELSSEDIYESFRVIEKSDVCIGPTLDGGYYLIGMKEMQERLFIEDMKWGNNTVLEGTFRLIDKLGLSVGLAPKQRDIDTKDDFLYLLEKLRILESSESAPNNTIEFLRSYRKGESRDERHART